MYPSNTVLTVYICTTLAGTGGHGDPEGFGENAQAYEGDNEDDNKEGDIKEDGN